MGHENGNSKIGVFFGTDYYTANTAIKTLAGDGVLEAANGFKRNRVFVFKRYMEIFSRKR